MPFYHRLGKLPSPKHTTFYKEDGKSLYREELFSTLGFSGIYSTKYHCNMPTQVVRSKERPAAESVDWPDAPLSYYHFLTDKDPLSGSYIDSRAVFMRNAHSTIGAIYPSEDTEQFFRNAYCHEMIFVHRGQGTLHSEYGRLPFRSGDYVMIPKSTTYRMEFDSWEGNKCLWLESTTPFDVPKHFRNDYGQLLEHAPYCERDIGLPQTLETIDKTGEFPLVLKAGERYFDYTLKNHPFDVVGWDGYVYPFTFNIKDYNPIVGRIHLPPPVHIVFTTQHFVVCNFVPRLFDFHERAIPAPYFHSNIDSDEVLYYVEGNFMSRKGVEQGSITLHPMGIPHGPQPGKTEASVGAKETHEYAVMIDTFAPLEVTKHVEKRMAAGYEQSWLE